MKRNAKGLAIALITTIFFCACNNGKKSPDATGFTYSEDFQNKLLEECITAEDGSTIEIPEGKFLLKKPLSLDGKKHLTIKGAGAGKSLLSFLHQSEGGEVICSLPIVTISLLKDLPSRMQKAIILSC